MMKTTDMQQPHQRLAAALIGGSALLEVVMVTHHPVISRAEADASNPFGGLAAIMQTNLTFHAFLMLVVVGQFLGLVLFARRLGLHRPLVLVGLLLCGAAAILMVTAMTFDGFVTYELISRCSASNAGCGGGATDALRLAVSIIQAFTKLGFGAQCLGLLALGSAMWTLGGRARVATAVSVIAALAPLVMITSGQYVGPRQLMEVLAMLGAWGISVTVVLVLEAFAPETVDSEIGTSARLPDRKTRQLAEGDG